MNVPPSRRIRALVLGDAAVTEGLRAEADTVAALAGLSSLEFLAPGAPRPEKAAVAVAAGMEIFLPLAGLIDLAEEERRLRKEIEKTRAEWDRLERKLANPQFVEKAPEVVVAKERGRAEEMRESLAKLQASLDRVLAAA